MRHANSLYGAQSLCKLKSTLFWSSGSERKLLRSVREGPMRWRAWRHPFLWASETKRQPGMEVTRHDVDSASLRMRTDETSHNPRGSHESRESRSSERLLARWRPEVCLQILKYGAAKNNNNGNLTQESILMEELLEGSFELSLR